jgi:hypothetical protein
MYWHYFRKNTLDKLHIYVYPKDHDILANKLTCLRAGRPENSVRLPSWAEIYLLPRASRLDLGLIQPPTQLVLSLFPREQSGGDVKLTIHLHLVSRLRISGALNLLPMRVRGE